MELVEPEFAEISEIEKLRQEAREAVISANVNPSLLSPEEHRRVRLVQEMASRVVIEANSTISPTNHLPNIWAVSGLIPQRT